MCVNAHAKHGALADSNRLSRRFNGDSREAIKALTQHRFEASMQFMLPLCAGIKVAQTLFDAIIDALIITGFCRVPVQVKGYEPLKHNDAATRMPS